jgi:hypothetical protein
MALADWKFLSGSVCYITEIRLAGVCAGSEGECEKKKKKVPSSANTKEKKNMRLLSLVSWY